MTVANAPDAGISPQEVGRRLDELRALYLFGLALRESRFVDEPSVVREESPPYGEPPPEPPRRDA